MTTSTVSTPRQLIGCHHCGLLQYQPVIKGRGRTRCKRCQSTLTHHKNVDFQKPLALSITGIILFLITNAYPMLTLRVEGRAQEAGLLSSVKYFFSHEMYLLSGLMLITCFIVPLVQLFALIYLHVPLVRGRVARHSAQILRLLYRIAPWGMVEIFLLGILVSMIKLGKLATLNPGVAMWSYIALILTLTSASSSFDPHAIWKILPLQRPWHPPRFDAPYFICPACHLTFGSGASKKYHATCPRCALKVYHRKPQSLQRASALVITAIIFYIPANLFPITHMSALGTDQSDTILSGVIFFMTSGSWHIALVIFLASVAIPLAKLLILIYLIFSAHRSVKLTPEMRTRIYHLTELVGRWSMVDVYVVAALVTLVRLNPLAVITAGSGVLYFAAVVVITMFAAESFDPRILWDKETSHE